MMRGATMIVCVQVIERMATRLARSDVEMIGQRCNRTIVKQAVFAQAASAKCEREARREDAQQIDQGDSSSCAAPNAA